MTYYLDEIQGFIDRSQARQSQVQSVIDQRRLNAASSQFTQPKGAGKQSGSSPIHGPGPVPKHGKISLQELMNRIAEHESGGSYQALGSTVDSGDRAYGKYQIMGNNIPSWTSDVLGRSLSPEQFLHNRKAQDRVARAKLGYYYKRYGAGGAAAAWYGGESVAKDWKKYKNGYYYNSTGSTRFPSIFEYVKEILRGG